MTKKELEEQMKKLEEMKKEIKELQQQYPIKPPKPRIIIKRVKKG